MIAALIGLNAGLIKAGYLCFLVLMSLLDNDNYSNLF